MPQSIEELINDKLNKLHKIHIAKAMPKALATQIFDKMGKDDIYESKQLIEFVKSFLGVNDDELILNAIEDMRKTNKLIVLERKDHTFYRKMDLSKFYFSILY